MARSVPPAGDRPADVGPGEELVVADDQRRRVGHVEARPDPADGQVEPARPRDLGVGEDLAESLDLGRVVAGDQDPVAAGGAVELGLDLGQLAREPLDALDPEVAGRLLRAGGERREGGRGMPDQASEGALDREEPAGVVDPAEVVAALLAEVVGLDERDPGPLGEDVGDVAEVAGVAVERGAGGQCDRVPSVANAWVSGSKGRIDSTSSPKNSTRTGSVESTGKMSRSATAEAELAGDLDDLDPAHRPLGEPGGQLLDGDRVADPDRARACARTSRVGTGCNSAWKARRRTGGRCACHPLDDPEPSAGNLVGGAGLARQMVPGGEDLGDDPGEGRQVVAEVVDVTDVRQHEHERLGVEPQRRRRQRGGRTPVLSIVAPWPFWSDASTSGNPEARWMTRVKSFSSRIVVEEVVETLGMAGGTTP